MSRCGILLPTGFALIVEPSTTQTEKAINTAHYTIGGVKIEKLAKQETCLRLVQFGKGQPITCRCKKYCESRNKTPEEARASVAKSLGIVL